jgi:hypothetical protein
MAKLKKETRGRTKIKIMEQTFEEYLKKTSADFKTQNLKICTKD